MPKNAPLWVLNPDVEPTGRVTQAQVKEALDALQVDLKGCSGEEAVGRLAVALVRHLMRANGYTRETGLPTL
jgi:hypothetical protein